MFSNNPSPDSWSKHTEIDHHLKASATLYTYELLFRVLSIYLTSICKVKLQVVRCNRSKMFTFTILPKVRIDFGRSLVLEALSIPIFIYSLQPTNRTTVKLSQVRRRILIGTIIIWVGDRRVFPSFTTILNRFLV